MVPPSGMRGMFRVPLMKRHLILHGSLGCGPQNSLSLDVKHITTSDTDSEADMDEVFTLWFVHIR